MKTGIQAKSATLMNKTVIITIVRNRIDIFFCSLNDSENRLLYPVRSEEQETITNRKRIKVGALIPEVKSQHQLSASH